MNFSAILVLLGFVFSTSLASCNKGGSVATEDSVLTQLDMTNVSYGTNAAQKMDVYLPPARNTDSTKVIVFIHGGSWSGGDKMDFNEAIVAIKSRLSDFAIFNINYRLASASGNKFPAQIDDIQAALKFIENKADEYKINTDKIALVGASAGAHLALLQAYRYNEDNKIKAVVDLFGPSDLKDLYFNHPAPQASQGVLINLLGSTAGGNASLYQQASPINYITNASVPTQIFHGTDDYVVPISQSTILKSRLQANNVKVDMTTYARQGHGWYGPDLIDTYTKTIQFIKENVR